MPIYEYECGSCQHTLEALQKITDAPLSSCPECKETTLRKKISAVRFRLKGSGWYETDFKTGNKKNLAGSGSDSDSGSSSSAGSSGNSTSPKQTSTNAASPG